MLWTWEKSAAAVLFLASMLFVSHGFTTKRSFASHSRNTKSLSMTASPTTFAKYQGLGNDFILVDNRVSNQPVYTPEQAEKLCNRNFGIGADGVIFALPGINGCDYTMRIYNSDGSEPQMCGNGIRCMAKFLQDLEQRSNTDTTYKIWTNAGVIVPKVSKDGSITVDMGEPILEPQRIPTTLQATKDSKVIKASITALGTTYQTTAVSMGNPHSVIFVDSLDNMKPEFSVIGPILERHEAFPQRVNTEFVQVLSRQHLRMKVWERGAGPTLACGTGACAVVVAAVLNDLTERKCTVTLPGGDLLIDWDAKDNRIYMTGPAEIVFQGNVDMKL